MKSAAKIEAPRILVTMNSEEDRSFQDTVQGGLRILARIIARETTGERRMKPEVTKPDSSRPQTLPVTIEEHS
jgi:hypothetical protein